MANSTWVQTKVSSPPAVPNCAASTLSEAVFVCIVRLVCIRVVLTPRNWWMRSGSAVEAQWKRSGSAVEAQWKRSGSAVEAQRMCSVTTAVT